MTEKNGDEKKPLSTHIVEVIEEPVGWSKSPQSLASLIQNGYAALNLRAKDEDSVILGVVQAVSTYQSDGKPFVLVVLTAQRIGREDLEKQQRAIQEQQQRMILLQQGRLR